MSDTRSPRWSPLRASARRPSPPPEQRSLRHLSWNVGKSRVADAFGAALDTVDTQADAHGLVELLSVPLADRKMARSLRGQATIASVRMRRGRNRKGVVGAH